MTTDWTSFVLRHTRLQPPAGVPEIQLHLARDIMALWQQMAHTVDDYETPPPFWAFAWAGGQALARYLLDHREECDGKHVLDFGSGSGLCAIAAWKAGAVQVMTADIDPLAGITSALNARSNGVTLLHIEHDLLDSEPPEVDLILAGDLAYERVLAGRVRTWLRAAHRRGVRVLIGDPGRDFFVPTGLTRLALFQVPTTFELEGAAGKQAGVFTFA